MKKILFLFLLTPCVCNAQFIAADSIERVSVSISPITITTIDTSIVYNRVVTVNKQSLDYARKIVSLDIQLDYYNNGILADKPNSPTAQITKTLIADNSSVCNPSTGLFICYSYQVGDTSQQSSPVYRIQWMYQYDFFYHVANTYPVIINNVERQFIYDQDNRHLFN